eukprot:TRINITY_DN5327_c2_g1_i1.p1 TRINITY_DN5327_c2_g1~~TRINITY_DN5327_c2_g1_i1.p1  ORF type:complete len:604 (+),score=110.65 TRINITY_DN5327_c2_g1_i1:36-1847(+)
MPQTCSDFEDFFNEEEEEEEEETMPPAKKRKTKQTEEIDVAPLKVCNEHPSVIHTGGTCQLAASPKNPAGLAKIFSYLKSINAIDEAEEEWHPLVVAIAEKEGIDTPTPPCVVTVKVKSDFYMKYRAKQLALKAPFNTWYTPAGDTKTPALNISLKTNVTLFDHQKEVLSRICSNGYAGSGMVVLPCGSGKTLTGLALAAKINKSTLIICNSLTSVAQWQASLRQFCNINHGFTQGVFSLKTKFTKDDNCVFTTYSILGTDRGTMDKSNLGRLQIEVKKWGLVILDEVHVVPTQTFTKAMGRFNAKCIIGLTATPLREDNKLANLPYLISPITFYEEGSWARLTKAGFLASVGCVEVRCAFNELFKEHYEELKKKPFKGSSQKRELIATCNPGKLRCCEALMKFHESQGDKVLIFCDSIFVLEYMSTAFDRPAIMGSTKDNLKIEILNSFRFSQVGTTILFSRIGDTSIDLPEANVIIEVGAHFGSRCQETQRFGRVSRPKKRNADAPKDSPDAFFYTLLTLDSDEVHFGAKRQKFLVEKGYDFITVSGEDVIDYHGDDILEDEVDGVDEDQLGLETEAEQKKLLEDLLAFKSTTGRAKKEAG